MNVSLVLLYHTSPLTSGLGSVATVRNAVAFPVIPVIDAPLPENRVAFTVPVTSSFCVGAAVAMPTLSSPASTKNRVADVVLAIRVSLSASAVLIISEDPEPTIADAVVAPVKAREYVAACVTVAF